MKKQLLIFGALLFSTIAYSQKTDTFTATGQGFFNVKCGVNSLDVQAWGAGGGGGRSTDRGQSTGGGGGGAYGKVSNILVSAGDTVPFYIGAGGSGGDSGKIGGDTWFSSPAILNAGGGQGVGTNDPSGAAGGISTGISGIVAWNGGKGGNGTGDGAIHASGGGGGAARITAIGLNGGNGTTGDVLFGGTGGKGGLSITPGGPGGDGAGSNGPGIDGVVFGGGGGGAKRGNSIFVFENKNGGAGANGGLSITYISTIITDDDVTPVSQILGPPGNIIGCPTTSVTLNAAKEDGYIGAGVSTIWYEGTTQPNFIFINEFMDSSAGATFYNTKDPTTLNSGNRRFTATNDDPGINMKLVLTSKAGFNTIINKYITIRYRVLSTPVIGNKFEIYFNKAGITGVRNEANKVVANLNSDGNWHIVNIDMYNGTTNWNHTGGNIDGIWFDYATKNGTIIDIDYLLLGNISILDNANDDDSIITLDPTGAETVYNTIRISDQQASCNAAGIPYTQPTQTVIYRKDRTYQANSGGWNIPNNWLPGNVLPDLTNCVKILNGKEVTIDIVDAQAGSIDVEHGGKLTIAKDKALFVQNSITNHQSDGKNFIVKSDANLIQLSNAINIGKITVERNVTDINNAPTKMDYVYWSSPVANQITKGTAPGAFSPGTLSSSFFDYRESNDIFYQTNDTKFVVGKGYAIGAETGIDPRTNLPYKDGYNKDYQFIGTPHNGDYSIQITRSLDTNGYEHGYNLVGNPYPSNIYFDKLFSDNSTLIQNTVWFWKNNSFTPTQQGSGYGGNNYVVYNGTGGSNIDVNGIIQVGQGFLVKKIDLEIPGSPTPLLFKNLNLRLPTKGTFYQKDNDAKNRFWLKLISPDDVDNTQLIGYVGGATDGFEMNYDAEAFGLSSNLFYSLIDNKLLVIQGRANQFTNEDRINLGANFFKNGNYTIQVLKREGIFETSQTIYLKDKLTGVITNISQGSYTFEANKGVTEGRFEIIYKPQAVLVTDNKVKDGVVVYRDSDNFIVQAPKTIATVEVYDLSGKLIMVVKANNRQAVLDASFFAKGMYVLRIKTVDGEITNKKFMKQ